MGVIQNAVNQMLGTVGIAARLSPGYETRQELSKLKKQEKAVNLQQEVLGPMVDPADYTKAEPSEAASKQFKESEEKLSDIKQKQFELKPTKEGAKELVLQRSRAGRGSFMTIPADPDEIMMEQQDAIRQEEAMKRVASKSEAQQKQKRNFKEYLRNQLTQFGGTLGDLGEKAVTAVAKQYSPAQRKQLMDKIDKENMKKDGNK